MFKRVGSTVVAHPWRVIAVWVVAAVAIVGLSPSLSDVTNADQTSFLPDDYPSVQAQEFAEEAFPEQSSGSSSIFVVTPEGGGPLTGAQVQAVSSFAEELQAAGIPRVQGVVTGPEQVAPEGEAQLVQVSLEGIASEEPVQEAVETLRDRADAAFEGSSLEVGLTGDAALLVDNQEAFSDAQSITLVATLGLILGLLLAIFRSPVAALMPLLSVGLVFATATSLVALLADGLGFEVGAESTSLLVVVLFGIGTDYILFLLFRYRERLRSGEAPKEAIRQAVGRVGRVIGSAALVVIVAFAALLLSELESFTTLAPSLFISVAVMLVAALTLIPAIVSLVGPRVFWPSKSWQQEPDGKLSKQIGGLIARRSGPTALASGGVLVALAVGVAFYQANYDTIDQLPGGTESAEAFEQLNDAFPAGASNPTNVYVRGDGGLQQGELRELRGALDEAADVAQVGEPQLAEAGDAAQIPVVLADSPFSNEALDAVKGPVREVADSSEAGTEVLVGGQTAAFADVRDAVNRDYTVVFPVAAALIALILGLLLRSLVAPLYLLGAVVLGFGATLGASGRRVFQGPRLGAGPDVLAADPPLPVRGGDRHRLQHPDGLPPARGGRGGERPPHRGRPGGRARGPDGRSRRGHSRGHVRVADADRRQPARPDGVRGVDRDRAGRVRDGRGVRAERHGADRPAGLVARPARHRPGRRGPREDLAARGGVLERSGGARRGRGRQARPLVRDLRRTLRAARAPRGGGRVTPEPGGAAPGAA